MSKTECNCQNCGKIFHYYQSTHKSRRFCSAKCRREYEMAHRKTYQKKQATLSESTCEWCGITYTLNKNRLGIRKYCSVGCLSAKSRSMENIGAGRSKLEIINLKSIIAPRWKTARAVNDLTLL